MMHRKHPQETLADIPKDCKLNRDAPFGITNVSQSMFSVARHFGGMNFKGHHYIYLPHSDELIRSDVLALIRKSKRQDRKKQIHTQDQQQELGITE